MLIIIELLRYLLLFPNCLKVSLLTSILVGPISDADKYQFGFKPGHSTGLCTSVLKRTVNYYTNRGIHVFLCFVDFSKAFDKINYWKLFNMLLDDGISVKMVQLLAFWYSHQVMCIKWNGVTSGCFTIANGTRQGGVLSPYLFNRYIRDMICDTQYCQISFRV